jgi:predicted ATPase
MIIEEAYVLDAGDDDPELQEQWPFTLPPVQQILSDGLTFGAPVTFLVGENGSGKSTIVEALAEVYGLDVRGGHAGRRYASPVGKGGLGERLKLRTTSKGSRMKGRKAKGFFLRAETAFAVFNFMSDHGVAGYGDKHLSEISHGEGFLQVMEGRFTEPGLYLMDEPEAALSFTSCLRLMSTMDNLTEIGAQIICATHSPVLAALPGAEIYEISDLGIHSVKWDDLQLVDHWRRYMEKPETYLRHVVNEQG